jgi:polysaccharide chain length determinant protein (PEP-CTERM system associated)
MNELILKIKNYIHSAWRFRWQGIIAAWFVALAGWLLIFSLPDQFQSEAKVYVDTESVLGPLLDELAVQNDMNQRLHLMSQTLLSEENLKKLLMMTDLDHNATTPQEEKQLIKWLGRTIVFEINRKPIPGSRDAAENFYIIRFVHGDRVVAQRVVKSLLKIFVESALSDKVEAYAAQQFLQEQIGKFEKRLVDAENRLTAFKRKHVDALPQESGDIFNQLETARTDLNTVQMEVKEATIRRDELKRQYDTTLQEEQRRTKALGLTAASNSPMAQRLLAMQSRMDELLLKYTENHPDVKELKSKINDLKRQIENSPESAVPVSSSSNSSSGGAPSALEQLKLAYRQSEVDLRAVSMRAKEYQNRVATLKTKLDTLPKVEAELTRLSRDYDINKETYQKLVQRFESAKISEKAGEAEDNLKFRVVEKPSMPLLPIGPKRLLLSAAILIVALALGGGVAFLMSLFKPVFFDMRTLRDELEFPVLGEVSRVLTNEVKMKHRIEVGGFVSVFITLVILFVGVASIYVAGYREHILAMI